MPDVFFVGGKGGVGKSTVAVALGFALSERGRTLVASTDPAHSLSDILSEGIGPSPKKVGENLFCVEIDVEKELDRYVTSAKRQLFSAVSPAVAERLSRFIDILRDSPGTVEYATFEKIVQIVSNPSSYRYVVFDTAPTGHTLRLFVLPDLLQSWLEELVKRRREVLRLEAMRSLGEKSFEELLEKDALHRSLERRLESVKRAVKVFRNREHLHIFFVLNPEKLPFEETRRAIRALSDIGVPVSGVIVNRVIPKDLEGKLPEVLVRESRFWLNRIRSDLGVPVLAEIPLLMGGVRPETIREMAGALGRVIA